MVCPYNDLAAVEEMFARQGEEIACVIVEPIAGNMGLIPGERAFLEGLSRVTKKYGAVLIFDEVISGFRASFGGAAQVYGVTPDMVCFGKIIGSGLPVGAYAGRREIMEMISPAGPCLLYTSARFPEAETETVIIKSTGDRIQDRCV